MLDRTVTTQETVTAPEAPATLGQRLRQARVGAGLTQSELAESRFSKQYVSQIERDRLRPGDETLRWLADRVGVDPQYLATGVDGRERERLESLLVRGEAALEAHDYAEAISLLGGVADALPPESAGDLLLRALLAEAWARMYIGEMGGALPLLSRARVISESPSFSDVDRAEVLFRLGCCRYRMTSVTTAMALYTEALELAERSGIPCDRLRSRIFGWRSRCYRRQRDWEAAREDVERALELAEALGDRRATADAYFLGALVAERRGQWLAARNYAEQAKRLYEEIEDRANTGKLLTTLGGLTFLLGNAGESLPFFSQVAWTSSTRSETPSLSSAAPCWSRGASRKPRRSSGRPRRALSSSRPQATRLRRGPHRPSSRSSAARREQRSTSTSAPSRRSRTSASRKGGERTREPGISSDPSRHRRIARREHDRHRIPRRAVGLSSPGARKSGRLSAGRAAFEASTALSRRSSTPARTTARIAPRRASRLHLELGDRRAAEAVDRPLGQLRRARHDLHAVAGDERRVLGLGPAGERGVPGHGCRGGDRRPLARYGEDLPPEVARQAALVVASPLAREPLVGVGRLELGEYLAERSARPRATQGGGVDRRGPPAQLDELGGRRAEGDDTGERDVQPLALRPRGQQRVPPEVRARRQRMAVDTLALLARGEEHGHREASAPQPRAQLGCGLLLRPARRERGQRLDHRLGGVRSGGAVAAELLLLELPSERGRGRLE